MGVHRALGLAGGARGIEPEARVVGGGVRRCRHGRGRGQLGLEVQRPLGQRPRGLGDEQGAHLVRCARHGVLQHGQQRTRDQGGLRAAVVQHVGIVVGREQGVDRHGHHARVEAAEEGHGPVAAVVHEQQHALLAPQAGGGEGRGQAARAVFERAVAEAAPVVDIGRALCTLPVEAEQVLGKIESWGQAHGVVSCGRLVVGWRGLSRKAAQSPSAARTPGLACTAARWW